MTTPRGCISLITSPVAVLEITYSNLRHFGSLSGKNCFDWTDCLLNSTKISTVISQQG